MTTHRCPKHDVLFESQKPPTQDGHAKCPVCNPREKESAKGGDAAKEPETRVGID
jgi:hypothetical protein